MAFIFLKFCQEPDFIRLFFVVLGGCLCSI